MIDGFIFPLMGWSLSILNIVEISFNGFIHQRVFYSMSDQLLQFTIGKDIWDSLYLNKYADVQYRVYVRWRVNGLWMDR